MSAGLEVSAWPTADSRLTDVPHEVVVIGAGVVGLSIALRVQAQGRQVLLVEREAIAAGPSRGNAGALAYADILPLASPGILRQAPRWLLDPLGPLALRPAYLPNMLPWLWRFWRASQPALVAASTQVQIGLMALAEREMRPLLALAEAESMLRQDGNLHLYDSEAQWRASLPNWQLRAQHGIGFEHLQGAEAIAHWQPGLNPALRWATFVPHWHTLTDPLLWCQRLAAAATRVASSGLLAARLGAPAGRPCK